MDPRRLLLSLLTAVVPGTIVGFVLRMGECFTDDIVPIVTWYSLSLGNCADTCRGVPDCRSAEYHFKTLQCRIHESSNATMMPCNEAAIFDVGNETLMSLSGCYCAKCSTGKNAPESSHLGHSVKFCPRLALNDFTYPLGNMQSIGSKVVYFCRRGFQLQGVDVETELECLSNATWTFDDQCTPLCNATELGYTDNEKPSAPPADELLILSPNGTSTVSDPRPPLSLKDAMGASCRQVSHDDTCRYSVLPEQPHTTFENGTSLMFADDCAYEMEDTMLIADGAGDYFRVYMLH